MTNKQNVSLMLSVERELLERIARPQLKPRDETVRRRAITDLRALLDGSICQKCKGSGEIDSGGVYPWGEGINIPCDCNPAAQQQGDFESWWVETGEQLTKHEIGLKDLMQCAYESKPNVQKHGEPVAEVVATGGPHDEDDRILVELQAELPPAGTKLYVCPVKEHPIITTLRDNGELIALRATVAQQAQMIEWLQSKA